MNNFFKSGMKAYLNYFQAFFFLSEPLPQAPNLQNKCALHSTNLLWRKVLPHGSSVTFTQTRELCTHTVHCDAFVHLHFLLGVFAKECERK